jgi:hypothetical protein
MLIDGLVTHGDHAPYLWGVADLLRAPILSYGIFHDLPILWAELGFPSCYATPFHGLLVGLAVGVVRVVAIVVQIAFELAGNGGV